MTTTEQQLIRMCKANGVKLHGVYYKDQLPKFEPGLNWLINLDNHDDPRNGTHWVCVKNRYYFDAYGQPPPIEVIDWGRKDILYNHKRYQSLKSSACGWFCVYFLAGKPLSQLTTNEEQLWKNDAILRSKLKTK